MFTPCKDKVGNVFAKFVGTQCGVKKITIWVAKPIVPKFLGPNLVWDQQAKTCSIVVSWSALKTWLSREELRYLNYSYFVKPSNF
jgi:hypothetical protein